MKSTSTGNGRTLVDEIKGLDVEGGGTSDREVDIGVVSEIVRVSETVVSRGGP